MKNITGLEFRQYLEQFYKGEKEGYPELDMVLLEIAGRDFLISGTITPETEIENAKQWTLYNGETDSDSDTIYYQNIVDFDIEIFNLDGKKIALFYYPLDKPIFL